MSAKLNDVVSNAAFFQAIQCIEIAQRGFLAHDQRISGLEAIDAHAVAAYAPFQFESRWQPIGKMPDQMHARLGARDVGSLEMMLQRVDQAVAAKRVNGANAA